MKRKALLLILLIGVILSWMNFSVVSLKAAETKVSLDETNVSYDLKMLYGKENWQSFDLNDILPKNTTSKDLSFKFYAAKPVGSSLYLYLYLDTGYSYKDMVVISSKFKISTSTNFNSDTITITEEYVTYDAQILNTYGSFGTFIKFKIDNVVLDSNSQQRVFIKDFYLTYLTKYTREVRYNISKEINDEVSFQQGSDGKYVYDYWKDDFLRITDAEVKGWFIPKDYEYKLAELAIMYWAADEHWYYFFDTNRTIDELIEVQYDYELTTYNVSTKEIYNLDIAFYMGLYGDENHFQDVKWFSEPVTQLKQGNRVKNEPNIVEIPDNLFFWKRRERKFVFDNIVNIKEPKIEDVNFKNFINENNKKPNGGKYAWAFKVATTERKWLRSYFTNPIEMVYKRRQETNCNEVMNTMVTWLKFRTGNQVFELNVLDEPREVTGVTVAYEPFPSLIDMLKDMFKTVVGNAQNWIDSLIKILKVILFFLVITIALVFFDKILSITSRKRL